MSALTPSRALAFSALASVAALAAALVAQYQFDIKPCPWCVMQRGIFILIAVVSALGWLLQRFSAARVLSLLLVGALAVAGLVAAGYQHEVAAKLASCDMTFADRVLTALDLEARWPSVFMVTASCSEASAYTLLGQPYEIWSGLLFTLIALFSLLSVKHRRLNRR
ncbi:disulfide bond formation protein B [Roseateles amylovorans]|uniref:Disulfide bond formation protein B n=1 Tax=Roseateles amylovorans TaxID=2978473 RepID=A0ABY6B6Y2_9BURK|nr:disulfide bond formation protein B [Roseateles amylovorans]UXH80093.1 disulfide bond formation protein B [Roseateles amylovorans]